MAERHDEGLFRSRHLIEMFLRFKARLTPATDAGELVDAFQVGGENNDQREMNDDYPPLTFDEGVPPL